MPFFIYKAKSSNGSPQKGYIYSKTKESLYEFLKTRNMQLLYAYIPFKFMTQSYSQSESFLFLKSLFLTLAQLLNAQIPLLDALNMVANQTKPLSFKKILSELIFDLEQGCSLSSAFGKNETFFGRVVIQQIVLAEASASYKDAFEKLYDYFDWKISVRTKITMALRYPLILLVFMVCIMMGFNTYLLPELLSFLKSNNMESDSIHFWLSFQNILWILFPTVFALSGLFILLKKQNKIPTSLLKKMYYLPFGALRYEREIAGFLYTLGLLLDSRVDMKTAFAVASQDIQLSYLKDDLKYAEHLIVQGSSLSDSLTIILFHDPMIARFLSLGEKAGTLDKNLILCSGILYNRFYGKIESIMQILQPSLLLFVGGMLFWIVSIFILPIYDVLSNGSIS